MKQYYVKYTINNGVRTPYDISIDVESGLTAKDSMNNILNKIIKEHEDNYYVKPYKQDIDILVLTSLN